MAKSELEKLREEFDRFKREVSRQTDAGHVAPAEPEVQTDYVPHGSDKHAGMLGLKKAKEVDNPKLDGWAIEDIVSFGPTVSLVFLEQLLQGKVNELTMKIPEVQSRDPLAPHFAPVMWRPPMSLSQITE